MPIAIRKPYDDHKRVKQEVGETSLVQASLEAETDINNIMRKYEQTQQWTHVNRYMEQYADVSDVTDYKTSLERMYAADEMFMSLPARIREQFQNDPGNFVEFATNPDNLDVLREMGLAEPQKAGEAERPKLEEKPAAKVPKEPKTPDPKGDQ